MTKWISLTTDFGLDDPFVGTMKGVIAGICPQARIIDLTHGVQPFNVVEGAIKLWQGARYFPSGTVHVAVVDPGVGSDRRPLLGHFGACYYIAPDNGLLSWVLADAEAADLPIWVRHLTNEEYFLSAGSRTFHGRDIFAPVAANLAAGVSEEEFGPLIVEHGRTVKASPPLVKLANTRATRTGASNGEGVEIHGAVLMTDRFGNLLTNIRRDDLPTHAGSMFALRIGDTDITKLSQHFAEGMPGEPVALFGSSGLLEIAVNRGNAQQLLRAEPGETVVLRS
jgi:S-adenosylmethionine hydrolase